jgi:hypothetical protein
MIAILPWARFSTLRRYRRCDLERHDGDVVRVAARGEIVCIMRLMSKLRSKALIVPQADAILGVKKRKRVPHEFVLEAIAPLSPRTNPMFGCLAVYVGEKIVLILRDKKDKTADNGVWLATTEEHHESLRAELPNLRSIAVFGKKVTGWQVLPADAADFEEAAMRACELILAGDPRIGKIPKERKGSVAARKQKGKLRGV